MKNYKLNREKMTPIAMRCNKEQWDELRPILESVGLEVRKIDSFDIFNYIINNYMDEMGVIDNLNNARKADHNRTPYETFNFETFLSACGIEEVISKIETTDKPLTIAQQLGVTEFPFVIKDNRGNEIYFENIDNTWVKQQYDKNGCIVYREDSNGRISNYRPKPLPEYTYEQLKEIVGHEFKIKTEK